MTQTSESSRDETESDPSERLMTSDPGLGAGPVLCVSVSALDDANLGSGNSRRKYELVSQE